MANTMQGDPHLELLGFTNSPPKRVGRHRPPSQKDRLTVDECPKLTMEQANRALERSPAAHRKSVQSMEKPQMSKAPRQVSSDT
jgi:hypothetical protein